MNTEDETRREIWAAITGPQPRSKNASLADRAVNAAVARAERDRAEIERWKRAAVVMGNEIERTLASALGYPKYGDVDDDPPGNPDDYVIGDHTAESLASEAARALAQARPSGTGDTAQVTRVEVIIDSERRLIAYGASDVETHVQDERRTLKVFLREPDRLIESWEQS